MQEFNNDTLERRLAEMRSATASPELRSRVLAGVHDELRAAGWDRRLARAAVVLLAVGIGLNASVGLQQDRPLKTQITVDRSSQSLVDAAVAVAEATDPETGRQYARHLAAQSGRPLSADQWSAIDDAITRRTTRL